jgi:hypothetical protein
MRSRTIRRLTWGLALLPLLLVGCSKSKPGQPAAQGGPALSGAAADGAGGAGAAPAAGATAGPIDQLIVSLRQEMRPRIAQAIGVGNVGELSFYDIDLQLDLDGGTFEGLEQLDFHNRTTESLDRVVLRVYGNEFGREGEGPPVTVRSAKVGGAAVAVENPGPTTFIVPLPAPLAPGKRVQLEVAFAGKVPQQEPGQTGMLRQGLDMLKGLFGAGGGGIEGYGILSMGDGIVSLAAWYPALSRYYADEKRWDVDEPTGIGDVGTEELANYRVRVRIPGQSVVASSGVEVARGASPTDVTYGGVALRDFTVLASRTYLVVERVVGETTVRAYVPQGREQFAQRILDYAVSSLEVYERRFGPYTLTELDVAAAPLIGGAGGVEFPGIITVATMLMQNLSESFGALAPSGMDRLPILDEMVEFVVVHEVAHQWWNGLIGSESVRHPFVDEGMAQYSSVLYFEDRYGPERAVQTGDRNVKLNYHVYRLMGSPDGTVDRGTGDFSGALEYAALVYGKGPYFWPAVRRAIGDDAFWRTLRAYYDRYVYKVAEPDAFARLAGELTGKTDELLALHRHWFHETHGDEDLGQADLGQLIQMVMGDSASAGDLAQMLQGLGGTEGIGQLLQMLSGGGGADGGTGPDLAQLMQLLQGAGGAGGDVDGGTGLDPDRLAVMMQLLQGMMGGGGSTVGVDGPFGEFGPVIDMARRMLEPMAATNPNIARLLEMIDRMLRGEDVSLAELLPLAMEALQSIRGLFGTDTADGGAAPDMQQLMQLLGTMGGAPAPAPAAGPDAGAP